MLRAGSLVIAALGWGSCGSAGSTRIMGNETYGICIAFLSVSQLGGLGDPGVSGAVGIRMLQYLARGEEAAGRRFLANARGVFLGLALLCLVGFLVAAPWIPGWLKVMPTPESGSLRLLFIVGGLSAALLILGGYFNDLNAIHREPGLARDPRPDAGASRPAQAMADRETRRTFVWTQYAAILCASIMLLVLTAIMLRISHPWLGNLWPIAFDWGEMKNLVSASFWIYLLSLGNLIYVATDQLLVTRGFGAERVTRATSTTSCARSSTASFLAPQPLPAMPGIARRLLSPDPAERANGRGGLERLQQYQAFAACVFAIGYLCVNDWFISLWQGPAYRHAPGPANHVRLESCHHHRRRRRAADPQPVGRLRAEDLRIDHWRRRPPESDAFVHRHEGRLAGGHRGRDRRRAVRGDFDHEPFDLPAAQPVVAGLAAAHLAGADRGRWGCVRCCATGCRRPVQPAHWLLDFPAWS